MLVRKFPTILTAWHGLIEELAYNHEKIGAIGQGGITTSYPDTVAVEIKDILKDEGLHLNMSSFGRMRFTQFLKRYFRRDLSEWVHQTASGLTELNKHQVASYGINLNPRFEQIGRKGYGSSSRGHRWGSCLSSLALQYIPTPRVILISRASQLDKAGFLDLSLMHMVAEATGWEEVSGTWIISMCFIAAVAQMYYVRRFNKPLRGHSLEKSTRRFWKDPKDCHYGPQRRSVRKAIEWQRTGQIARSCPVSELSLEF